jgi:LysR family glycine cleavage system transcriptional activator
MPLGYRLPSLNALRAFEAAGRLGSFTEAAGELCVTQGAISRHIGLLEKSLGLSLFRRQARGVELTPAAKDYLVALQTAFEGIERATKLLNVHTPGNILRVTSLPTFLSNWLLPRLPRFYELHPDVMLSFHTTYDMTEHDRDEVDVSIEVSRNAPPNLNVERLLDIELLPVCHPVSVAGLPPPRDWAELRRHTLLHNHARSDFWGSWAKGVGFGDISAMRGFFFETSALIYQAARDGIGVAIGIRGFLEQDLMAGTLIAPFDGIVTYHEAYSMVTAREKLELPMVKRFREWLLAEARSTMPPPARHPISVQPVGANTQG